MKRILAEKGFSMIEIMVATFLLFFALSILITVIGGAATILSNSRALDRATYLANEKIEFIRSLPFDSVGYVTPDATEPAGTLPRSETVTIAGNQFTIDYSIKWVDDPKDLVGAADPNPNDYKRVIITVNWTIPTPSQYVLASNISGRKNLGVPPSVEFVSPTPNNNSVISGSVNIAVHATRGSTSSAIAYVGLDIGGGILGFGQTHNPAVDDVTDQFTWNTAALDTTTGARITPDGIYEARGIGRDSIGLESFISYFFTVNNSPPEQVTTATVQAFATTTTVSSRDTTYSAGPVGFQLNWEQVYDGREKVDTYHIYQNAALLTTATGSSYIDSGLTGWTDYAYQIATYSHGDEATETAFNPASLRAWFGVDGYLRKQGSNYYPRLGWPAPPVAVNHYHIYKSTGGAFVDYATTSSRSWEDSVSMDSGLTWTYYVVAHDGASVYIDRSNAVIFTR